MQRDSFCSSFEKQQPTDRQGLLRSRGRSKHAMVRSQEGRGGADKVRPLGEKRVEARNGSVPGEAGRGGKGSAPKREERRSKEEGRGKGAERVEARNGSVPGEAGRGGKGLAPGGKREERRAKREERREKRVATEIASLLGENKHLADDKNISANLN